MFYITVKLPPMYRQMTLEELLFGTGTYTQTMINPNSTSTRTYEVERVSDRFLDNFDIPKLVTRLINFNESTEALRSKSRRELYHTFYIPKKRGGLRKIDAPNPELMDALRQLKTIFEDDFKALYHTNAFSYIKHRSTIDAVKKHQANESKWFAKYDLSNFFGSTTIDFVIKMFGLVFPFSEVLKSSVGESVFRKAIELAFLDGGLPQGTPISPLITNIMMIPVDYKLSNGLRNFNDQRFIYTRYADDFIISSRHTFNFREIEKFVTDTLKGFDAPFDIKSEKTRYGSSAGSNWNLGVMLNKDNNITIGHKNKRRFQAMIASYIMDKQSGVNWDKSDVQTMEGYRNYYRMIEGDAIDRIVDHIGSKFGVDVIQLIKKDLQV